MAKKKSKVNKKKVSKRKIVEKTAKRAVAKELSPKQAMLERKLQVGLEETFPGSDAIAVTNPVIKVGD